MLGLASFTTFDTADTLTRLLRAVFLVAAAMAPLVLGVAFVAIVVNLIQVGFTLNGKRLQPNLGALNPTKGVGRLFGKGKGPVQFGLNVAKLLALSFAAWSAVRDRMAQIISVQQLEFLQIFGLGAEIIYSIGIRIGIVLLVIAIVEYAYQRWKIEQELKMTKQEVKDEMRRMEGDPQIKQRRRQIAMHASRERMKKDVPTADVIVTNPTEFAVALKYEHGTMHAPRVVAKGQGLMAQRIREIAIAHGVPILERKPLARALFKLCEVGQEIPEDFYSAVAEILAYVYELTGKSRRPAAV
jgi:flagellar biosynthetic protein FlhB